MLGVSDGFPGREDGEFDALVVGESPCRNFTTGTSVPADPIPDHITRGQYEISGVVRTGNDERTRGTRDAAPLRIDGMRGNWEEIEELWLAGGLTDDEFEDHFVDEVIVEDIGEGTDGWEFPGASYTVEVR
ncbi:hypothetical protein ACWDG9_41100 [Streptomyces sp. NPDC001073]